MKKLILLVILISISSQSSFAGLNSSPSEMGYKKKKALSWYNHRINHKLYGNDTREEITFHKSKAMRWHKNKTAAFNNETNSLKKKSLSWYKRNSK